MKLQTPNLLLFISGMFTIFLFSACDEIIDPPRQSISVEEARVLQEEFITTRAGILNDSLGFTDTREFWFSLDSLKNYIAYVEQEGKKMGKENLGIRIYFAAYPQNSNYPDAGFATVFLAPTAAAQVSDLQRGFFPIHPGHENLEGINALNFGHAGQPPNDY